MPQLELGLHRIHFDDYGDQPVPLVGLHGFGESSRFFRQIGPALTPHFRVLAPDLPFHGQSLWQADQFLLSELATMVQSLAGSTPRPFALAGHSFGARIALCLLPFFAHRLQRVVLISPDGFGVRWLPLLAKLPPPLRERLLRWTESPENLLKWARRLYRLKLLDAFALQFLEHHLSNQQRRRRLVGTGRSLSHLQPDLRAVRSAIEIHRLRVDLCFGQRDELVSEKKARRALKGLTSVHFHRIDDGHRPAPETLRKVLKEILPNRT